MAKYLYVGPNASHGALGALVSGETVLDLTEEAAAGWGETVKATQVDATSVTGPAPVAEAAAPALAPIRKPRPVPEPNS